LLVGSAPSMVLNINKAPVWRKRTPSYASTIPTALPLSGVRCVTRVRSCVRNKAALVSSTKPTALPLTGKRLLARVRSFVLLVWSCDGFSLVLLRIIGIQHVELRAVSGRGRGHIERCSSKHLWLWSLLLTLNFHTVLFPFPFVWCAIVSPCMRFPHG
jgi:hypothetical protein